MKSDCKTTQTRRRIAVNSDQGNSSQSLIASITAEAYWLQSSPLFATECNTAISFDCGNSPDILVQFINFAGTICKIDLEHMINVKPANYSSQIYKHGTISVVSLSTYVPSLCFPEMRLWKITYQSDNVMSQYAEWLSLISNHDSSGLLWRPLLLDLLFVFFSRMWMLEDHKLRLPWLSPTLYLQISNHLALPMKVQSPLHCNMKLTYASILFEDACTWQHYRIALDFLGTSLIS